MPNYADEKIPLSDHDKKLIEKESALRSKEQGRLAKLVAEYQGGNDECFDDIYMIYKPKFERLAYRMNCEDIVQELSISLINAVNTYKDDSPAKFNTYFWHCARNRIGTINIYNTAQKRTAEFGEISLNKQISTDDNVQMEIGDAIEDKDSYDKYDESLFKTFLTNDVYRYLRESDIKAVELLLEGYTLEEIGEQLDGITAPAVHIKLRRLKDKEKAGLNLKRWFSAYNKR